MNSSNLLAKSELGGFQAIVKEYNSLSQELADLKAKQERKAYLDKVIEGLMSELKSLQGSVGDFAPTVTSTKGKRGRPKGSTNKGISGTAVKGKRGRPKGSKNKSTLEATVATKRGPGRPKASVNAEAGDTLVKRRGRPKGSKNKAASETIVSNKGPALKRRGRPKGSKNKVILDQGAKVETEAVASSSAEQTVPVASSSARIDSINTDLGRIIVGLLDRPSAEHAKYFESRPADAVGLKVTEIKEIAEREKLVDSENSMRDITKMLRFLQDDGHIVLDEQTRLYKIA